MTNLRALLPPGTQVKKYYDQSEIIAEASQGILQAVLIGAVLAVLVLYFFLGALRPTLIVALTIPLSLLAALAVMGLFGLSRNVITMTALTTMFALIPIAVGTTVGSRIFQPFAITVIGGLISGTLATLIIVPTLLVTLVRRSSCGITCDSH